MHGVCPSVQGYAFNTYGEVFACWVQDAIIVGLIFRHMRLSWGTITAATAAFAATCALLFSPVCPVEVRVCFSCAPSPFGERCPLR
jgi:hypothetical protein